MPRHPRLPLAAAVAALSLSACGTADDPANEALADNVVILDNVIDVGEAPLIETGDAVAAVPVAVAPLPARPAGASAVETAPLEEAEAIEREITRGEGIERVRYGEGWAWTRGGRILRTADRDGRNVEYFRSGETRPFFVQQNDRAYAYRDGRAVREYDRDGRSRVPDSTRQREAEQAERIARERREAAERAREQARRPDAQRTPVARDPRPRPGASPSPSPTPTATATPRGRDREESRGPGADRRPTPSPTATPRDRRPTPTPTATPRDRRDPERPRREDLRDVPHRGE